MDSVIRYRKIVDLLPTYVPGKPIEDVQKELGLNQVIKLASNENPWGPSPVVLEQLARSLGNIRLYPDGNGTSLKTKIAAKYGMKESGIILGNGSDEILMLIALAYINEGDEVLISEQTFSEYLFTSKCMNAKTVWVPQVEYRYDLLGFAEKLSPLTKVVYLCNPNNPTGTIFSASELRVFLDKVSPQTLVVIDEAYYEYVTDSSYPETISLLAEYENLIITRTFSKIYGLAGLRIGYALGNPGVISTINKVREPFNVNSLALVAAATAMDDLEYLLQVRQLNEKAKAYIYEELTSLSIPFVQSHANFVLFQPDMAADVFFERMLQQGIIVRAMKGFGLPKHIRVTTGTDVETLEFIRKLKEIL